ncbi:MAG TPA: WYL domain-containing protein [Polyangia bacterium]|nr:WYL domain-containing protein [Polyangia bacterium]
MSGRLSVGRARVKVGSGRKEGTYKQAARVVRLLDALRRHVGLTMAEIAARFEITERQVRRDLVAVEEAGYVLDRTIDDTGRARVRIADIRPGTIQLGVRERFTLLAVRRVFDVLRGTAFFEDVESIYDKLAGALPEAEQKDLQMLGGRFVFLPDRGTKDYRRKADVLDGLLTGIMYRRVVRYSYRASGAPAVRGGEMAPYALALYRNGIYVVADRPEPEAADRKTPPFSPTVYAVERFQKAECLRGRTFEVPKTFGVEDYFEGAFGVTRGGPRRRVVVDFRPEAAEAVTARAWHRSQKLTRRPGGGVRISFEVDDLNEILSWVLSWGPLAVVREPPELVARATAELRAAAAAYRSG